MSKAESAGHISLGQETERWSVGHSPHSPFYVPQGLKQEMVPPSFNVGLPATF